MATPTPQKPVRPIWMPSGGRGALLFWGGLSLVLAIGLLYLYRGFAVQERRGRLLRDDQQRLVGENEKLRSEIDKLQTELSQAGSILKNREQILRETTESLQAVKAQSDQEGQLAEISRRARTDLQAELQKALDPAPPADSFAIWIEGDHVVIRLGNSLLFDASDIAPNAKGVDLLKKVAAALKTAPTDQEIVIDSHTDNAPPAPSAPGTPVKAPNNWDLSARRAAAVVRIFADAGITPNRLVPRGLAGSRPIASNDTADRVKNRRIEIMVRPTAPASAPAPAVTASVAPAPTSAQ